jgi:hypothetical protein
MQFTTLQSRVLFSYNLRIHIALKFLNGFLCFVHHVLKFGHQESYNIIEPLSYKHFFILTPTFFLNLHVLCSCSNPSKILSI